MASKSFTVSAVSGGGSKTSDQTGFGSDELIITRITAAPVQAGDSWKIQLFQKDTYATADLAYDSGTVTGNHDDPREDDAGVYTARTEDNLPVCLYEDEDATAELHVKITNNDAGIRDFNVTVHYREPAYKTAGNLGIGTASPTFAVDAHSSGATAYTPTAATNDSNIIVAAMNDDNTGDDAAIRIRTRTTSAAIWELHTVFTGAFAGDLAFKTRTGATTYAERLRLSNAGSVGIGAATPSGQLHVDQDSATGAIPVLYLDQGDDSEEMIEFAGTIGVGNAIEAVGVKTLTTTHFIKVTLPGGLTRYFPVGTIA